MKRHTIDDLIAKFKPIFDDFIKNGGDVNSLTKKDKIFADLRNFNLLNDQGALYGINEKFKLLGIDRECQRVTDVKQHLIDKIEEYRKCGGSFHKERKQLPFYQDLMIYSNNFKRRGIYKSPEEIMHDLGYREYSDMYLKCMGILKLKEYRDFEGYVDDYKSDIKYAGYINNLAELMHVPSFVLVELIANEKARKHKIPVDYLNMVKHELNKHVAEYGSLKGLMIKNKKLYRRFNYLVKTFSDGTETEFNKIDWLDTFGLSDVEHDFQEIESEIIDIKPIMRNLKLKYENNAIGRKDIDSYDYALICRKATKMGLGVGELMRIYEINYKDLDKPRLSHIYTDRVPYLQEMKEYRDELIAKSEVSLKAGYCKEEVFLDRIKKCLIVYSAFKEAIQEELIGSYELEKETTIEI